MNPIPASRDSPTTSHQARSSSSSALVNRAKTQVPPNTPTSLPRTSPSITASAASSAEAVAEATPDDAHPGGEEREHRHGHPGRERPQPVLEPLRHIDIRVEGADAAPSHAA